MAAGHVVSLTCRSCKRNVSAPKLRNACEILSGVRRGMFPGGAADSDAVCGHWPQTLAARAFVNGIQI